MQGRLARHHRFRRSPSRFPTRRKRSPCCARATSGHVAIPPANAMNSRRLMSALRRSGGGIVAPYVEVQEGPPKGDVAYGSWPCENSNARRARRNILKKLRVTRTNNAADVRLDAMLENCIFYIFLMYEFSHSQGHSRHRPISAMSAFHRSDQRANIPKSTLCTRIAPCTAAIQPVIRSPRRRAAGSPG